MIAEIFVTVLAALLCGGLSLAALVREERGPGNLALASGMALLAMTLALQTLSNSVVGGEAIVFWKRLELIPRSLLPGTWLLFSLTYARAEPGEHLWRGRWPLAGAFAVPLLCVTLPSGWFFDLAGELDETVTTILPLGWAGTAFHLLTLVVAAGVLANLEATLRATRGSKRWRVKYLLIGIGSFEAAEIYLASQALLYASSDLLLVPLRAYAALVAGAFASIALARSEGTKVEIRLSHAVIYNSLSVLVVGGYLVAVGILAELLEIYGADSSALGVLAVFVLLVALALVILSDQIREELRRFVSRNFYAPAYDYRKEWIELTHRTALLTDLGELSGAIARSVSETFGIDSVTIWRLDEASGEVLLGGSTELSERQVRESRTIRNAAAGMLALLREREESIDFGAAEPDAEAAALAARHREFFETTRVDLALPLVAARRMVGALTLGPRITKTRLSLEDRDLLQTICEQAATSLLGLQLGEQVVRAKEMEAFQTLSSFFVHDLKNLASMLSLTVQNLPRNFENPDFRRDALKVIQESVDKMNAMCAQLSTLGRKLEIRPRPTDLNRLVADTLARLDGSLRVSPTSELQPLPPIPLDAEQIEKVLTNLLLNASEAIGDGGQIHVATEKHDGRVILTVSDDGQGMSEEFVRSRLFRPFQTTKSRGLGIGLFQSRRLVEAHGGRVEVESEAGRGTTFRVYLPVRPSASI